MSPPLADEENLWVATYTPATMPAETAYALKISPFQRSRQILSAETLAEAVKGADKYATAKIMKGPMAAG